MNGLGNPSGGGLLTANLLAEIKARGATDQAAARGNLGFGDAGSNAKRNRLLNGDFRLDQQNAGVSFGGANFNGPDKWKIVTVSTGTYNGARQIAAQPGLFGCYLRFTVTTADAAPIAGANYALFQHIEGTYCQDLEFGFATQKSVTVSFWVRSSLTGNFSGSLRNSGQTRSYPFSFSILAANTWEYKTVTIGVDQAGTWLTNNFTGVTLTFDLGSGANFRSAAGAWAAGNFTGVTGAASLLANLGASFDLTGVQLEPGTVATPFEQTPAGEMVRLCQREFQKTFPLETAPAQNAGVGLGEIYVPAQKAGALANLFSWRYPVKMRATPVITGFNPSVANSQARDTTGALDCATTNFSQTNEDATNINTLGNAGTAVGNALAIHLTADARL